MRREACAPENQPPLDIMEVTDDAPPDVIAAARAVCQDCPVLATCAPYVKRREIHGVAAGLTHGERAAWMARHRIRPDVADIVDVTPARELTAEILDDLPTTTSGDLHPRVRSVVLRMTEAGMTADEIVTRLNRDDVTHRTVNYVRRTYMKGPARVVVS
ncbi:WhiB family transcriptional regulator [Cellulomonas sp. C5510]|uniref:WhiB family transcriptional regulator n=1 Tax=Cellulomonas sp. C5510 TaxID=2871170 RepID=UPI001C9690FC|nr:WhiB family transcriptional regulator [Cellulomonas sp. C5510]QZN86921.1 WhiB family transcriptional regulator [Cellulomonas sp. C5510]